MRQHQHDALRDKLKQVLKEPVGTQDLRAAAAGAAAAAAGVEAAAVAAGT